MEKKKAEKKKVSDIDLLKPEDAEKYINTIDVFKEAEGGIDIGELPPLAKTPIEKFVETDKLETKDSPKLRKEMDTNLSFEERIEAFIEDKKEWLKLNDFLKSLYSIPKFNEPPAYLDKGEMKRMRILLDNMQSHGKLQIKDNGHGKLGNHYYEGEQQYAKFYHIGILTIEAKK